ncbi:MAG: BlaI/MecI/CopY family transcriptional regulator [Acidimicrobiales bacterium]
MGGVGPLEREAVEVLWEARRPLTVRDVRVLLNRRRSDALAYTTVMTILSRLVDKGVLRREQVGRGYQYEPVAKDAAGVAVKSVLRDFGEAALAHFVEETQSDPKLRRRLRALMDGHGHLQSPRGIPSRSSARPG